MEFTTELAQLNKVFDSLINKLDETKGKELIELLNQAVSVSKIMDNLNILEDKLKK